MDWRILQMADVGFPTGGFTLSSGLEAAWRLGEVGNEEGAYQFMSESLRQASRGGLPLLTRAYKEPENFGEINALCQAFLTNPVANRASRLQGSAFLYACERAFYPPGLGDLRESAGAEHALHFAPVFGRVTACLGIPLEEARRLFLFLGLRDLLSAAVRLGVLGPYQAQRLQAGYSGQLERAARAPEMEPVQTAPLLDLFQAAHDGLDAKLFQS